MTVILTAKWGCLNCRIFNPLFWVEITNLFLQCNDVDCGVVGKNCGNRRKDRKKVIDEDGEEGGTNNRALRNTRGRKGSQERSMIQQHE